MPEAHHPLPGRQGGRGDEQKPPPDRRAFLASASAVAMAGGLAASYGCLALMAGRFLYPAKEIPKGWMFLIQVDELRPGDSFHYSAPDGAKVAVARVGSGGSSDDFLALSSTCPHLGCQVHWEAQNDRFFCPCHNGTFNRRGEATGGPPLAAGQSLLRFELRVEKGLLFILVPVNAVARAGNASRDKGQALL